MHVQRLISPSLFFYLSVIPASYAEDSENLQKKLVDIFGEQISRDQRITAIPDNALTEIGQLSNSIDTEERRKKSILSVVAKGFVHSEYGTTSNKRRISTEEWAAISNTARDIERAAFHQNPDGSSLNNLDFENFLIQYSKTASFFSGNKNFTDWLAVQDTKSGSESKTYPYSSVAKYFTEKLRTDCGKDIPEKAEHLKASLELSKILLDKQTTIQRELRLNPELYASLPMDFVELAQKQGISLIDPKSHNLSDEALSAFSIYIELLSKSLDEAYFIKGANSAVQFVNNTATSRESKYSKLSNLVKADLLAISFVLAQNNFSAEEASSAYSHFISNTRKALAQQTISNGASAYDHFVSFAQRLKQSSLVENDKPSRLQQANHTTRTIKD